VLFVILQDSV
jgi:hypothetical protein